MAARVEMERNYPRYGVHEKVWAKACPHCGTELHFSRLTVLLSCKCGKCYRLQYQQSPRQELTQ
jgi:hypothetical protein